jgi:hypothetical protein
MAKSMTLADPGSPAALAAVLDVLRSEDGCCAQNAGELETRTSPSIRSRGCDSSSSCSASVTGPRAGHRKMTLKTPAFS